MSSATDSANSLTSQESLQGVIESIVFHSEDSGFVVMRVKVPKSKDTQLVVGKILQVHVGESIKCSGSWVKHKSHGLQFSANEIETLAPDTLEGIRRYLGSGLVKGVGEHFANILVDKFGDKVFEVIEKEPRKLRRVPGLGNKRCEMIQKSWREQKSIRDIMIFLQGHGIGTGRAVRIYKTYGQEAIKKIEDNPYCLARDVYGIGFKIADELAFRLGIEKDSPIRARAGVRFALYENANRGHTAIMSDKLAEIAAEMLEISKEIIIDAIRSEVYAGSMLAETVDANTEDTDTYLMSSRLYTAECEIAEHLSRLSKHSLPWKKIIPDKAIEWVEQKISMTLADKQREAVIAALQTKCLVITGGPGVGKTTIVNSILKILKRCQLKIALCAPTGRAAKRLGESTNMVGLSKTIHRTLEFDPNTRSFKYNETDPMDIDLLIVDEASMIDTNLMHDLLSAIPNRAALIMVGDIDQLPSVSAGAVLKDIIESEHIKTVRLTEIYRQAKESKIVTNAHKINQGIVPIVEKSEDLTDFYLISANSPEDISQKILQLVQTRIPKRFGFKPMTEIQVLSPMNKGPLGTKNLNIQLQNLLNPGQQQVIKRFGNDYKVGDKVIQTVNNYDKEVFNGDIGFITGIDSKEQIVYVNFDGDKLEYQYNELDELLLAYAISIHKSQGSEYPCVVIPLSMQHYAMLARNLLYTGVTRGRKLVILLAEPKALAMAVSQFRARPRLTRLQARIKTVFGDLPVDSCSQDSHNVDHYSD